MRRSAIPDNLFGIPLRRGIRAGQITLLAATVGSAIAAELLHPGLYLLTGITLVSQVPMALARRFFGPSRGRHSSATRRDITDAQVYALIDKRHPSLTARRLAAATETTDEVAEAKLSEMSVEGKLESSVPEDEYEIHYVRASGGGIES